MFPDDVSPLAPTCNVLQILINIINREFSKLNLNYRKILEGTFSMAEKEKKHRSDMRLDICQRISDHLE